MKKYLLVLSLLFAAFACKAQSSLENLNNHAYYYRVYEYPPKFPTDFFINLDKRVKCPKDISEDIAGQLIIHAVIDTSGTIIDPLIVRSVSEQVDREVLKAMEKLPKVQPAMYKGKKVPAIAVVVMNIEINAKKHAIKITRDDVAVRRELLLSRRVFDVAPVFTGPSNNIYKYISDNITYPIGIRANLNGIIGVTYDIDTTGNIKNILVVKTLSKEIDQIVMDVLAKAPGYTPGSMHHIKVITPDRINLVINVDTIRKTITAKPYKPRIITTNNYIVNNDSTLNTTAISDTTLYSATQVSPSYPGGEAAFNMYLKEHVIYPAYAKAQRIQGTVFVQFVIERNGDLTEVKVMRAPSQDLGEEAAEVIKASGKWLPGEQNGKQVRVLYTVPIKFTLNR